MSGSLVTPGRGGSDGNSVLLRLFALACLIGPDRLVIHVLDGFDLALLAVVVLHPIHASIDLARGGREPDRVGEVQIGAWRLQGQQISLVDARPYRDHILALRILAEVLEPFGAEVMHAALWRRGVTLEQREIRRIALLRRLRQRGQGNGRSQRDDGEPACGFHGRTPARTTHYNARPG